MLTAATLGSPTSGMTQTLSRSEFKSYPRPVRSRGLSCPDKPEPSAKNYEDCEKVVSRLARGRAGRSRCSATICHSFDTQRFNEEKIIMLMPGHRLGVMRPRWLSRWTRRRQQQEQEQGEGAV
ncbi:Procathepsin L [Frankliniella fusca]|uniref:Procathepsin L n=1 Tax=Frankliniella fusca TaxID=407009 RepID=A0AAE1LYX7_9NEOP|nr:Procathepsin L [Frankliniella fusca]